MKKSCVYITSYEHISCNNRGEHNNADSNDYWIVYLT